MPCVFGSSVGKARTDGDLRVKNRSTVSLGRRLLMSEGCSKPSLRVFSDKQESRVVPSLDG